MCHCNACRHSTGQLAVNIAPMAGPPLTEDSTMELQTVADLSSPKIKAYVASPGGHVEQYFCGTCSAHLLYEVKQTATEGGSGTPGTRWLVSTGALRRVEGVVKVGYHIFVEFTRDGGLADCYRLQDEVEIPRYYARRKDDGTLLPYEWKADSIASSAEHMTKKEKDFLELYCDCKTISLRIERATAEEAEDPAKWWAVAKKDDSGRERHLAVHCLATSCRTTSGAIISSVMFTDKAHIFDGHTGLPVSFLEGAAGRPKGLVRYKSSEYVCRESCGTCGAAVFYWNVDPSKRHIPRPDADGQPVVIDVYAGLVDQENGGARAEGWLAWYDKVMNIGDAIDKSGMEALVEGVNAVAR